MSPMNGPPESSFGAAAAIPRRRVLAAAGLGAATVLTGGPNVLKAQAEPEEPGTMIDCYGEHQAGVTTPMQRHLQIAGFDLKSTTRRELEELLRSWQHAIERLTAGQRLGGSADLNAAPRDTGEALGQGAASLTVTIGFGASLFDERFGLRSRRPAPLIDLPRFAVDDLDAARGGGDLSVQACADQQLVAEHAIRDLAKLGSSAVELRWVQSGFNEPPTRPRPATGRNLLGFKDGTANLKGSDQARMRRNVWVSLQDGPRWMTGGTYQVYRRIRLRINDWDSSPLDEQQDVFGRHKSSGAPYGGSKEFDPVNSAMLPVDSHVRLANPRTGKGSEDERILRRGYNFHDGYDAATGEYDAGLAFIAYQRDPRRQFVTIQTRLAASDALNEYLVHTASGIFAIPPGAYRGSFVGSSLLDPSLDVARPG
jgi:deferrochelatase/peroxidase EfeB